MLLLQQHSRQIRNAVRFLIHQNLTTFLLAEQLAFVGALGFCYDFERIAGFVQASKFTQFAEGDKALDRVRELYHREGLP